MSAADRETMLRGLAIWVLRLAISGASLRVDGRGCEPEERKMAFDIRVGTEERKLMKGKLKVLIVDHNVGDSLGAWFCF